MKNSLRWSRLACLNKVLPYHTIPYHTMNNSPYYITTNHVTDFRDENDNVERRIQVFNTTSLPSTTPGIDRWIYDNTMDCIVWIAEQLEAHYQHIAKDELWYEPTVSRNLTIPNNEGLSLFQLHVRDICPADFKDAETSTLETTPTIHERFIQEYRIQHMNEEDDMHEVVWWTRTKITFSTIGKVHPNLIQKGLEMAVLSRRHQQKMQLASSIFTYSHQCPLHTKRRTSKKQIFTHIHQRLLHTKRHTPKKQIFMHIHQRPLHTKRHTTKKQIFTYSHQHALHTKRRTSRKQIFTNIHQHPLHTKWNTTKKQIFTHSHQCSCDVRPLSIFASGASPSEWEVEEQVDEEQEFDRDGDPANPPLSSQSYWTNIKTWWPW